MGIRLPEQGAPRRFSPRATALICTNALRTALIGGAVALVILGGCTGLAKRYRRDDVVLARQIARQGADAFHAGDWERAEEYYAKAVEVCPVDERVRAKYAEAMWNRDLRREAIEHQVEAVRLSGGDPDLMIRLGEMYLAQGEWRKANELAERVIDAGRGSAAAFRLQGDVLEHQGQWRDALAAYHRALSIAPHDAELRMALARVHQRAGRPQRALTTLQSLGATYASGEEPVDLLYWEGVALASLGRHPRAVEQLERALDRGLDTADLYYRLAESRYLLGERVGAEQALTLGLERDPAHAQASRLTAAILGDRQFAQTLPAGSNGQPRGRRR